MSASPALRPGELVGRYRVEAFVAAGGMGDVFKAWDLTLERHVALKTIRGDLAGQGAALQRFQREAQILAKLDHPGICQVFDWMDRASGFVMAMEWVEGEPLSARLAGGPLPPGEAVAILQGIASALAAAHGQGIIHRDLKPSNVIITPTGEPKVLDFGLAKTSSDSAPNPVEPPVPQEDLPTRPGFPETESGVIMGTRGFLAPERILGAAPTAAVDIFALGVLACLMLTGELPSPKVVSGQHTAPPRLKESSGAKVRQPRVAPLWRLVESMLAPEAAHRPTAAQVLGTLNSLVAPPSPWWWAAGAAALTLVIGGSAWGLFGRGALPEYSASRKARVVVVPVLNLTGRPTLNAAAQVTHDLLEHALRLFPALQVVQDRPPVDPRHPEPGMDRAGAENAEEGRISEVALRTGAQFMVVAELGPGAPGPRLSVRLMTSQGEVRARETYLEPSPGYDPGRAVAALLQGLGRSLTPVGGHRSPAKLPLAQALAAYSAAEEAQEQGRDQECIARLEQAVEADPRFVQAVLRLGQRRRARGDADTAPTFRWAQALFREAGDTGGQARTVISLAQDPGLPTLRKARLEEALGLAQASGEPDLEGQVLNLLGEEAIRNKDYALAGDLLSRAMPKFLQTGFRTELASVWINLGNLAWYQSNLAEARRCYEEALATSKFKGGAFFQSRALNNLGTIDLREQRPEAAEKAFEEVLAIRESLADREGMVRVLLNLGIAAQMRGEPARARGRFTEARATAESHHFRELEGRAHYCLGDLLRAEGQFRAASAELSAARGILVKEQAGTRRNRAEVLADLAECTARAGDPAGAEALLQEAMDHDQGLPQIWRARAWLQKARGQDRQALASLERALADPGKDDPEHQAEVRQILLAWGSRSQAKRD